MSKKPSELAPVAKIRDEDDDEVIRLGDIKSIDTTELMQDEVGQGMWDAEIKAFMDMYTLKGLFYHEDWVFILIDMVASHVAMSPLKVYKRKVVKNKEYVDPVANHPLNTFFEQPNEYQEYFAWMYNATVEDCLMGNTIEWRAKKSDQLVILPTETVLMKFESNLKVSEYVVTATGGYAAELVPDGVSFNPSEIWHQRRPNPSSMMWGLSPFIANRKSILFNRYTQDYLNAFYLKGATPGLALKMEKNVAEDSAMRFLRSFEVAHTGRRNMRRTIMLPKGVDVKTLTPNIGDQKLVEMINSNRERILNILRVPKHALSLAENGSLGSEEHKVALKLFFSSAIFPIQMKRGAHLTRRFRMEGRLKDNEFLQFDNSAVEALKEDAIARAQLGQALREQWTLNEIRQQIHDMEPIEGGDAFPGSTGNSTQPDKPNSGTVQEPTSDTPDAKPKPGEDPKPAAAAADPKPNKAMVDEEDEGAEGEAIRHARVKVIGERYGAVLEASTKQMDIALDGIASQMAVWLAAYASMAARAVDVVGKELARLPIRTKADDDVPSKKPKRDRVKAKLTAAFEKDADATATAQSEQLIGTMEGGYGIGISTVFDQPALDEITVLRERDTDKRLHTLKARGMTTFADVSESTTEKILEVLAAGVEAQKTIKEITNDVVDAVGELGRTRAEMIARTEVLTAVSIGKAAAMENAGEVIDDLVKVWINAGDSRVRHPPTSKANHVRLQGAVVAKDEPFDNGLFYPRDPKSRKAEEVCNCRCDWLVVSQRDLAQLNIPKT